MSKIRAAVFPVAGMGTRFLPATKANPKEMLPIVDKPLIQYAVEEAIAAGITRLVFVTSSSKRAIEDHFDTNYELEDRLTSKGKDDILKTVRDILPPHVVATYVRQPAPLGLGHAVLCAEPVVGNEPFAVVLADDLIDGQGRPCLKDMVALYEASHASGVLAVQKVAAEETEKYGMVDAKPDQQGRLKLHNIVEKPKPAAAPSDLGVVGRYVLSGNIFEILHNTQPGAGNEIQLTDAIATLMTYAPVYAHEFHGVRHDCGSKLGYMQATIAYGLQHPELGEPFKEYLTTHLPNILE